MHSIQWFSSVVSSSVISVEILWTVINVGSDPWVKMIFISIPFKLFSIHNSQSLFNDSNMCMCSAVFGLSIRGTYAQNIMMRTNNTLNSSLYDFTFFFGLFAVASAKESILNSSYKCLVTYLTFKFISFPYKRIWHTEHNGIAKSCEQWTNIIWD